MCSFETCRSDVSVGEMSTVVAGRGISAHSWLISTLEQIKKQSGYSRSNINKLSGHSLQHVFTLVWTGPSQRLHLVFSPSGAQGPTSSQHSHGGFGHAGKLEGEGPVEQDDDDAEDPFKDGRRVLEDKAFLAEEHAT